MKIYLIIVCLFFFGDATAQIKVKSSNVSHFVLDTTKGSLIFYLGDRAETQRKELTVKNKKELAGYIRVEAQATSEVNGLEAISKLCPLLSGMALEDSIRNGFSIENDNRRYFAKMKAPNLLKLAHQDESYNSPQSFDVLFVIAEIENCGQIIAIQKRNTSTPLGFLLFINNKWRFFENGQQYGRARTINECILGTSSADLYDQKKEGDTLFVSETCNDALLFAAKYDSIQFLTGLFMAYVGDSIYMIDLFNKPIRKEGIRHFSLINYREIAAQLIIGNELYAYNVESNKLEKRPDIHDFFISGCQSGKYRFFKSKSIVTLPDSSVFLHIIHDTFDGETQEAYQLPAYFKGYELDNYAANLQGAEYNLLCKSRQSGKYTLFLGNPVEDGYLGREVLTDFTYPTTEDMRYSNLYFRFLKNGLVGVYPLMQEGKYKQLEHFTGKYARYVAPDGKSGWLTMDGKEIEDIIVTKN
jgi:hypothetical protein